jgi:hypothetical protein
MMHHCVAYCKNRKIPLSNIDAITRGDSNRELYNLKFCMREYRRPYLGVAYSA